MPKTVLSWSGGKDAARALYELRERGEDPVELLTTVSAETGRSSMHGVRRALYERQAEALGADLRIVELPPEPDNDTYEERMAAVVADYADRGIDRLAFADIFLEDVRAYREERLADSPIEPVFPLWGRSSDDLAESFHELGFRAVVVAVDGEPLEESFVGRAYDRSFLGDLPAAVDPCGEEGAFHTFVWDGPIFGEPVPVAVGDPASKPVGDGTFHYCRLEADPEGTTGGR